MAKEKEKPVHPSKPEKVQVLKARKPQAFAAPITTRGAPSLQAVIQPVDPTGRLPVISKGLAAHVTIDNMTAFTVVGGVK